MGRLSAFEYLCVDCIGGICRENFVNNLVVRCKGPIFRKGTIRLGYCVWAMFVARPSFVVPCFPARVVAGGKVEVASQLHGKIMQTATS